MGMRGQRFALVIDGGVVKQVHVEAPGEFKVSSAEHILESLGVSDGPASFFYAGLLGLLLIALSAQVRARYAGAIAWASGRARRRAWAGDPRAGELRQYVPFAVMSAGPCGADGLPAAALHGAGILLVASRILHAIGLTKVRAVPWPVLRHGRHLARDRARSRSGFSRRLQELFDLRYQAEEVSDEAVIRDLEDRRLGVLVDRDDRARILDAGQVLDRAAEMPIGDVELRRNDLAGLADLQLVRRVAGVDGRTRGARRRRRACPRARGSA